MFEDYSIAKFTLSFIFVIFLIYGFYFVFMRYGQNLKITPRGKIKVEDLKFFSKDKGLVLVSIKDKTYFFTFDNQNGLKLIEKWKKNEGLNEKNS